MKKGLVSILAIAAFPTTLAMAAQYQRVPATICTQGGLGDYNNVASGATLVNWDSNAKSVSCAVPFQSTTLSPTSVNPSQARVEYSDLSPFADVTCQAWLVTSTGTNVGMGQKSSCSVAGGCASGDG